MTETGTEIQKTDDLLRQMLATATGIAWDGCHKIYVLLDEEQFDLMVSYEYGKTPTGDSELVEIESDGDREAAFTTVKEWYESSCGLRFINTVRTVDGDPNEGFDDVIAQCEDWVD